MSRPARRCNPSAPVRCCRAGLLAATLLCAAHAGAADAEPLTECRVAGIRNAVRCGVIQRALDPARPDGTRIDVHFVVVPAIARRKLPDPVFVLAGGPGQSAIQLAPAMTGLLNRLGNRRDIVFVDQRGTGRSAPLECADASHAPIAEQVDPQRQVQRLARCRAELQKLAYIRQPGDLRYFTTTIAMQDLDAVRERLGAQRINLIGASYGTRAALEYARQFPARVRRSVIDGVAPPDMVLPQSFGIDGPAAFDALLASCAGQTACAKDHPTLRADWAALVAGLPKQVSVTHPLTGRSESFVFTQEMLHAAVRGPLYSPALAAALPAAIGAAAKGDFAPLFGLGTLLSSRRGSQLAMGMHFSVVCAEDVPLLSTGVNPARAANGTVHLYTQVCADWPRGEVPPAFYRVLPSTAPLLLLSGGLDPATPPRHAERISHALGALAKHVVVPNAGHGVIGLGCMREVIHRFIDAADDSAALAVDANCAANIPRPPHFQPVGALAEAPR